MNSVFTEFSDSSAAQFRGWLFYDGHCRFCTRWARTLEPTLLARGVHVAALQDVWVQPMLGLSRAELLRAVRVWTPDGAQTTGADAILFLAEFVPWLRPLRWIARFRWGRNLLGGWYGRMAARRHCLHACAPALSTAR